MTTSAREVGSASGPARGQHGSESGETASVWSRSFALILIVNFLLSLAQYMTLAVVPVYAASLGATALLIGIVTGIFAITALGVRPFVGPATFRFRHSLLLAVTAAIILGAFVCYALSPSVPVLILGRLLHGMGMGFLAPVALAMASESLPRERMASGIGIFSLGQAVAMAAGPALGLALVGLIGYQGSFLAGAGIVAIALALSFALSSPPPVEKGPLKITWARVVAREALPAAVIIFFLAGAYSSVNSFLTVYAAGLGVPDIGLFFTTYAVAMLVSRPAAGRIADRFGLPAVVIPSMILFAVSFVLIASARSLSAFIVAAIVSALGYGVCQPAIQSLALLSVKRERRGVAGSTNYMGVDLAYLVMPVLSGWIVSVFHAAGDSTLSDGYSAMFLWMLLPVGIAFVAYIVVTIRARIRASRGNP